MIAKSNLMFDLTKLHLLSIKGNFVRYQKVRLPNGKDEEVTVFSGDGCLFLGQYTPLRTIAIHEEVLKRKSLLDYIMAHESAHKKQWWKLALIPIVLTVIWQAPVFLARSLTSLWETIVNQDLYYLVDFPYTILIAALFIALPFAFSWLLELDADFQAIRSIGFKKFFNLKNNELKPPKFKLNLRFLIDFMTHPPTPVTIFTWKCLQRCKDKFKKEENHGRQGNEFLSPIKY